MDSLTRRRGDAETRRRGGAEGNHFSSRSPRLRVNYCARVPISKRIGATTGTSNIQRFDGETLSSK